MATLTVKDIEALWETHDKVIKIEAILGDGNTGLCQDVKSNTRRLNKLEITVAAIIGSGALGGGIWGVVHLIGG